MPSANNLLTRALVAFALIASNAHASTSQAIEWQIFENQNCQGAPAFQEFQEFLQDVCYTGFSDPGPGNHIDVVDLGTHQVVATNIDSASFSCKRPTFSTGQNCEKHFHKTIGSYCFNVYEANQFQYAVKALCYPCRPFPTITKAHCNRLIHQCENLEIIEYYQGIPVPVQMKWTGRGCRADGKALGDGGCQCDGYCGYTCERACNADDQCYWDIGSNQCFSAETNTPGEPIKTCTPGEYESLFLPEAKQKNAKLPRFTKKP